MKHSLAAHPLVFLLLAFVMADPDRASAAPVVFTDETAFLEALAQTDYAIVHEDFEDDAAWGGVRSGIVGGSHTSPAVSHQGITWTANNDSSGITTSSGAALTGNWGVYSLPHGSYTSPDPGADCTIPEECGDGLRGTADEGVLYAVGGWFSGTYASELGLYVERYPGTPIDFGEVCDQDGENCIDNDILGTGAEFFGIIDPDGFAGFEFREREGTAEDQKFIFADTFHLAGSAIGTAESVAAWDVH